MSKFKRVLPNYNVSVTYYTHMYLMYWCDFLTVSKFAEYHELDERKAHKIILKGRILRETNFNYIT